MLISLNIPELLPATNCESSTQHLQSFFHHEEAGPGSRTWTVLAGPFPADHRPITSWSIALFLEPSDGLALIGMAMSSQQRHSLFRLIDTSVGLVPIYSKQSLALQLWLLSQT